MTDKEPKIHPLVKMGHALSILALAATQAGCKVLPTTSEAPLTSTPSTLVIEHPTIEPPTPTPSYTPTSTETATANPEQTPNWQVPNAEIWVSWLADPSFLKQFLINQFDPGQYKNLDPQYTQEFVSTNYPGNSCGEAVITELINMYTIRKTGENPGTTISDVINELLGKTSLIRPNGTDITDYNLKLAIDFFGQEKGLFSTVFLTPYCYGNCTSAIPGSEWSGLFKTAKKDVLDKGGVLVAFVQKGGNPPGSVGHFIIISGFNSGGEPLIIDSLDGSARVIDLGAYVDTQPGLLSLIGVVPTP